MTKTMPTKIKADITPEVVEPEYPDEYKPLYIPTRLIKLNRFNPRTEADITADEELRQSIAIRGIETPLHVRPIEEDEEGHIYETYDGDRRLRAAVKTKPCCCPPSVCLLCEYEATTECSRGGQFRNTKERKRMQSDSCKNRLAALITLCCLIIAFILTLPFAILWIVASALDEIYKR